MAQWFEQNYQSFEKFTFKVKEKTTTKYWFERNFDEFFSIYGENKRPFIYFEVIDLGGEPIKNTDYTWMARVSEFRYGKFLSEVFRKQNGQKLRYTSNFGAGLFKKIDEPVYLSVIFV